MSKASSSHNGNFVHVVIEMVEDGQRLEFDVGPGTERRKIRYEIGHCQGYGELYVERFVPEDENAELDLRVKLAVPPGAGDRPAAVESVGLLAGTHRHAGQLIDQQRAATRAMPKGEDGAPFLAEGEPPAALDVSTVAPGETSDEELAPPPRPALDELAQARQTAAPEVGEEAELQKLASGASVTVTPPIEATPEEIAALTNTTPPKPGEEKELDARNRKRQDRNYGFGRR